jgi:putative ABC transport system permease protein
MGNPIVAGRDLTWDEVHNYVPVVLVNEAFAREYWKSPSAAIGRRVRETPGSPWREIVGVVGNERDAGLALDPPAILYYPFLIKDLWHPGINAQGFLTYVVRSQRVNTPGFVSEIREALRSVNRDLPLASVRTLEEVSADAMAQTSFALVMLGIAASIALLLGVIGIYGVIAYVAVQRTREVGIRLALGAQPRDVRGLLLRHGLHLTCLGVAAGLGAAIALSHTMSALLFGVSATDVTTYSATSAALAAAAMLATWLPARRAARMNPLAALRS